MLPDLNATWNTVAVTPNTLYCGRIVPRLSLSAATTITNAWSGTATTPCTVGVAIYPDSDGATAITTASTDCPGAASPVDYFVSAFTINSGTRYRVCVCATVGQTYIGEVDNASKSESVLLRTFTTTALSTAASGCTAGVPNGTAPSLSAQTTMLIPEILIQP